MTKNSHRQGHIHTHKAAVLAAEGRARGWGTCGVTSHTHHLHRPTPYTASHTHHPLLHHLDPIRHPPTHSLTIWHSINPSTHPPIPPTPPNLSEQALHVVLEELGEVPEELGGVRAVDVAVVARDGHRHLLLHLERAVLLLGIGCCGGGVSGGVVGVWWTKRRVASINLWLG